MAQIPKESDFRTWDPTIGEKNHRDVPKKVDEQMGRGKDGEDRSWHKWDLCHAGWLELG
jgi:hypothetical protein